MTAGGRDPAVLDRVASHVRAGASWGEAVVSEGFKRSEKDAIRRAISRKRGPAREGAESAPLVEPRESPVTGRAPAEQDVGGPSLRAIGEPPPPARSPSRTAQSEDVPVQAELTDLANRIRSLEVREGHLSADVDAALDKLRTRLEAIPPAPAPAALDLTSITVELDRLRDVLYALVTHEFAGPPLSDRASAVAMEFVVEERRRRGA